MNNLSELRKAKKLTQQELALKAGLSRSTVQRHERDGVKKQRDIMNYKRVLGMK